MGIKEILQQYGAIVGPFLAVFAIILMNSDNKKNISKKNNEKKLNEKKINEIEKEKDSSTLMGSLTLLFVVILIFFTFKYGLKGFKYIYSLST